MDGPLRGIGVSTGFAAQCKECRQRDAGPDAGEFEYNVEWLAKIVDQGGNASDRCPSCRKEHKRRIRALPVPYVDLDTVGTVADRNDPQGPLGSLGPLPPPHEYRERTFDLSSIAFSLTDEHAVTLLEALRTKRVAVLIAGTGSGKSTFIPYRLLYPPKQDCLRLVERGPIIVTEPRREATARTAQMVARVLCGTPCGPGAPVGYRTGEEREDYWDEANQLLYVTDGSLLNWIKQGRLGNYGAIVIDEAHELNANIELILSLLAANLSRYPHLRVIIVSATIDPGPFVDLFGGPEKVEVLQIEDGVKDFGYGYPLWPGEAIDLDADLLRRKSLSTSRLP